MLQLQSALAAGPFRRAQATQGAEDSGASGWMIMIMMTATQLERLLIFLHRHRPTTTRHLGTFGAQQAPAVRGLRLTLQPRAPSWWHLAVPPKSDNNSLTKNPAALAKNFATARGGGHATTRRARPAP